MASSVPQAFAFEFTEEQQEVFDSLFHELRQQLNSGEEEPIVPFITASVLGSEGIRLLKAKLETVFDVSMTIDVDLIANTVKVLPVMAEAADYENDATASEHIEKKKEKVPRPPNAFILYRKEWHPHVVAANPGLHNNRISILLGEQWRGEPQSVRDEYKRRAALAKEEHAVLHPNYSYQPRKSSEKKRRMTKSKLARLGLAMSSYAPDIDFTSVPGHAILDIDRDFEGTLAAKLKHAKMNHNSPVPDFNATWIANTSDDEFTDDIAHLEGVTTASSAPAPCTVWNNMIELLDASHGSVCYTNDSTLPGPGYRGGKVTMTPIIDTISEIQRQNSLQEEMNALFDFDSAATTLTASTTYGIKEEDDGAAIDFFLIDPLLNESITV